MAYLVDGCENARRYPGIEGRADAMCQVVQQRFFSQYLIRDFLQVLLMGSAKNLLALLENRFEIKPKRI